MTAKRRLAEIERLTRRRIETDDGKRAKLEDDLVRMLIMSPDVQELIEAAHVDMGITPSMDMTPEKLDALVASHPKADELLQQGEQILHQRFGVHFLECLEAIQ